MEQHPLPAPRPGLEARSAVVSLVFILGLTVAAGADTPARKTVVAGNYNAGGFHRFFLGNEYRKAWGTPVSVEVLDLGKEAGGLTPARRVGGQQTKGLALSGADGRSYTFRGLEKDASHLLDVVDPSLKDSVFAKLLNDQMAAQHPGSELIARGVLETVGIPVPAWRLVVLPDDPALGPFRKDFAGAVGVFAVYPQPAKGTVPGFANATEIIDHTALYKKLEAGEGDTADTQALLKARLVDIFMGDWDRHRKQWRWARIPGNPSWVPIPEDRDQAFSRYEGAALASGRGRDPRFQKFGPKYPNIGGLTFNGSEQDRRLLAGFTTEDFVRTAKELQGQLTDAAIEKAVRTMPPEWYAVDGPRLVAEMKARRDALPDIAAKYHHHLGRDVDVYLTNQSERVEAKRLGNGDMDVTVRLADKDAAAPPTFHRVFDGHETSDVRFYGLGGNDTVVVTGGSRGPHVRLIGGAGNDTLDATGADNAKLSDTEGQNRAVDAGNDDHQYTPPPPPKNAPWIPPRDWTRESWGVPWVTYGGDIGVFLGYGIYTQKYGFRKTPFSTSHQVRAGWSFRQGSGRADYVSEFHRENRDSFFGVYAYASGVEVLRFYGFGNETTAPEDQDFNKVNANQFVLYPSFKVRFARKALLTLGPGLKYTESDEGANQFINTAKPYGVGKFGEVAVHGILSWDGRDNTVFPRKGLFAAARASYFPQTWDVTSDFGQVNGNVNAYLSAGKAVTFAFRAASKKVFGTYPYMEAAAIGEGGLGAGSSTLDEVRDNLRGHRARRYLGDASATFQSDVRLRLSHITLILPGAWGLSGFYDVGRVWLKGETSDTWHTGVGGGIWMSVLNDRLAFSTGISHGPEEDLVYFKGGFHF